MLYLGFWRSADGLLPLGWVYDNYVPLMTASILASAALSLYLYAASFAAPRSALAAGGATGYPLYDFFIGRQLNPRIGSFDLKEFCELYPGECLWGGVGWGGCGNGAGWWGRRGAACQALTPASHPLCRMPPRRPLSTPCPQASSAGWC